MMEGTHRVALEYLDGGFFVCFSRPDSSNSFEGLLFGDACCLGPHEETKVWQVRKLQAELCRSKVFILSHRDLLSSQTARSQKYLFFHFKCSLEDTQGASIFRQALLCSYFGLSRLITLFTAKFLCRSIYTSLISLKLHSMRTSWHLSLLSRVLWSEVLELKILLPMFSASSEASSVTSDVSKG